MFDGAPAVQVRVGFGHRQFQRCARARKSMEIPFPARSTIARLNIYPSFTLILLWIVNYFRLLVVAISEFLFWRFCRYR